MATLSAPNLSVAFHKGGLGTSMSCDHKGKNQEGRQQWQKAGKEATSGIFQQVSRIPSR